MPINYFIYDEVIDTFIEFQREEEYLLQYYIICNYYTDLNTSSNLNIIRNKKRKYIYLNKKMKKPKLF